jgi:hypothetical protein
VRSPVRLPVAGPLTWGDGRGPATLMLDMRPDAFVVLHHAWANQRLAEFVGTLGPEVGQLRLAQFAQSSQLSHLRQPGIRLRRRCKLWRFPDRRVGGADVSHMAVDERGNARPPPS